MTKRPRASRRQPEVRPGHDVLTSSTIATLVTTGSSDVIDPEDLDWFDRTLTDRTPAGGAVILAGRHVEALRVESSKKRPTG